MGGLEPVSERTCPQIRKLVDNSVIWTVSRAQPPGVTACRSNLRTLRARTQPIFRAVESQDGSMLRNGWPAPAPWMTALSVVASAVRNTAMAAFRVLLMSIRTRCQTIYASPNHRCRTRKSAAVAAGKVHMAALSQASLCPETVRGKPYSFRRPARCRFVRLARRL